MCRGWAELFTVDSFDCNVFEDLCDREGLSFLTVRWAASKGHFHILSVSSEDADVGGCNQLLSAKCISLGMLERLQKRLRTRSG